MASDAPELPEQPPHTVIRERLPVWARILKWVGIVVGVIAILFIALLFAINTGPGRGQITRFLSNYTLADGLNIQVGRIDGSIYGAMQLHDVRFNDVRGTFAVAPEIDIDWRPFAYLHNRVDVRSARAALVRITRMPAFKPTPPGPLLPNIDIDVSKLAIDRLELAQGVAGARRVVRVAGGAHIANRRAQVTLDAAAVNAPGIPGGDTLHLVLDAVPEQNRLNIDARLAAPAGGVVAGLTGLTKPLTVAIAGRGDWRAWNGRFAATLGGAPLANLAVTARNGNFGIQGSTYPGTYLPGTVARLAAPALQVSAQAALDNRAANTRFSLRSNALAVDGHGVVDLGKGRFGGLQIDTRLLTPGAIAPNLNGRDVAASFTLDGPFARPQVTYAINATALGFGTTVAQGVTARGSGVIDTQHIIVPVQAHVARVTGLSPSVGGLLTNVSLNGHLAVSGTQILSDDLHIRSDKIDATAIIVANTATGRYTGALKGRVNNYRIDGIGIIDVTTDAHLVTAPKGGFGITGHVVARTEQIFNSGARNFLGGNAIVRADVTVGPTGLVDFQNLRLASPQLAIVRGHGRYDPKGPVAIEADAISKQYGPISVRVTGTIASPNVVLHAAHPNFGVGLANVNATVKAEAGGYAVHATGTTSYGPFSADVLIHTGGAMVIDIRRARFAGMDITGRIQQTAAGPYAGRLQFAGSGITGTVLLSAVGRYQHAEIAARANNAKIPGVTQITIGRAIVNASVTLVPNAPQVIADVQVANLRYGGFTITTARAKVNETNGRGTAQLVANGAGTVPFTLGVAAQLSPNEYLAAIRGTASGIGFHTGTLARITKTAGGYQLAPTRIDFDRGTMRLAGSYGGGATRAQVRLDRLDLAVLNGFIPNLGVGGQASGSLDFTQPNGSTFPSADARLTIANFTRSSLATVSEPVNIVFAGQLVPTGGIARALVQRGTMTIGRMVANLQPLGPQAGSWTTRLMAAPLSGGIRYNGPAAVLFSLAGQARQQLTGPIAVGADFGGRVDAPTLTGLVRADNLTYENEQYGTRLTNLAIQGRFTSDRLELTSVTAKAGSGTITARGTVGLAAASGFPIDVTATLNNAQLARSDSLGATATGDVHITHGKGGGLIEGTLRIPSARYAIVRQGQAEVPELTGIRRRGEKLLSAAEREAMAEAAANAGLFKLNLHIRAPEQLFVSGMGLESEWGANFDVTGTSANPRVVGRAEIIRGTYSFSGKRFDISRGIVTFSGATPINPDLNIVATTTVNDVTAEIDITGTGQNPQVAFTSTPALPQDEVLSRLLFGSSVTNLSATEAIQLAAALNSLRGGGGGLNPLGKLRSATGIDRLRILGADATTGRGTALAAGKYITRNIYLEIVTDARGFTATQLEIALTKALKILSQTSSFGGSNASIRYTKDY